MSGMWWLGGALALPVAVLAGYWLHAGLTHPMINDIVTDTAQPLEFRGPAAPAPYAGEEFAREQRAAYPDVAPLMLAAAPEQVFALVKELVRERGWKVLAVDEADLRIEVTAQSLIFRFTDDIAIGVSVSHGETRVDMRSRSRVGRSDLGVNAKRIQTFLEDLAQRIKLAEV